MKEVQPFIPSITERDIRNVIAGKYKEQKATKRQLSIELNDLKTEQKLVDELYLDIEPFLFSGGIQLFSGQIKTTKLKLMGKKLYSKNIWKLKL